MRRFVTLVCGILAICSCSKVVHSDVDGGKAALMRFEADPSEENFETVRRYWSNLDGAFSMEFVALIYASVCKNPSLYRPFYSPANAAAKQFLDGIHLEGAEMYATVFGGKVPTGDWSFVTD